MIDVSEKRFEADIETFLLSEEGGYKSLPSSAFDRKKGLFFDTFLLFIQNTQPRQWKRYQTVYASGNPTEELYKRFDECVRNDGLISVLRKGIEDRGVKFDIAYFEPASSLNPELIEKYNSNILTCTRQFHYSPDNNNSIDMVLSLNGIPLIALELKDHLTGQTVDNAKHQYMYDRDPKELCFGFNRRILVYFAVDTYEVYMTTELKKEQTYFLPFNRGSNGAGNVGGSGNPANSEGYTTAYLWEYILQKNNLLKLLQRYISVQTIESTEIKNGIKSKKKSTRIIFPRYHQFDVVEKIIEDCLHYGSGKNYLIQHSAGSGKSNSIAWLTYKLASLYNNNNELLFSSVIIITDRKVLDKQLQDTVSGFDHKAGLVECIDESKTSQDLKKAINDNKKIIITTLQKFPVIFDQVNDPKGRNFAIIVDEAHSSQTGHSARKLKTALADTTEAEQEFADYLSAAETAPDYGDDDDEQDIIVKHFLNAQMLTQGRHKNLSFFAFTATPKQKTIDMFGVKQPDKRSKAFHVYSMRQAIEEGFILDVLKNYVTVEQYFKIARKTTENKEYKESPAIKAIMKYYASHKKVVSDIVAVIVEKFREVTLTKINGKAKAMVVCPSRKDAVRFYNAIKAYVQKKKYTDVNVLIAFSGKVELDGLEYEEAKLNKTSNGKRITEQGLPEYFAGDEFNTLVVADKYQTGFDEPKLHTMFILKKLNSVKAVQTLSRLNRTEKGKNDTFIMDFVNTTVEIQKSFQPFYEETILGGEFNINNVYDTKNKLLNFHLFNEDDIESFIKLYTKKEQTPTDLGKLTSIFNPIRDRFSNLTKEQKIEYKDLIKSFTRFYSYITQLIRMFDTNLHKTYLFCEYLGKVLPKFENENVNLDDKIKLEFSNIKQTFSGEITLKKSPDNKENVLKPIGDKGMKKRTEKVDLLQNIINKINIAFEGKFDDGDRVIVEAIYNRIISDDNKQLKRQAKNNTVEMFTSSIFPQTFEETAMDCYNNQTEAFTKLFENKQFFNTVMNVLGNALYNSLRQ
ncbi:MAG: DEAD/DEAH box helicase family protein [Treponema sp.]|nr:DEAD/DEAH box helicase family protein [Treponema sp.]